MNRMLNYMSLFDYFMKT